jgi:hypothetical protein
MTSYAMQDARRYEQTFDRVMALYTALHSINTLRVHRAQLNLKGEVTAEPIDFVCDVDIKAKRAGSDMYALMHADDVDKNLKVRLGRAFLFGGLDVDGDYKTVYFRVKNASAHNSMTTNEIPLANSATITEED